MAELTQREEERLRLALGLIGEAAVDPAPVRAVAWYRRRAVVAGGGLAAAAVCAVLLVGSLGADDAGSVRAGDPGDRSGEGQTYAEGIACARLIAEGDVVAVRPSAQEGRVRVTFAVQEWIKPASGGPRVELDLVDPAVAEVQEPFRAGEHLLLVVPVRRDLEADASRGALLTSMREVIDDNWAKAAGTECPAYWRTPPD